MSIDSIIGYRYGLIKSFCLSFGKQNTKFLNLVLDLDEQ